MTPPPTSWLDLLSPKYKGHVALIDFPLVTFNGLEPINRILGGTDGNLTKGFNAFEKAAKAGQFQSIFSSTSQIQNLLETGAVTLLGYPYGNVEPWIKEGMKLGFAVPTQGEVSFPLYFQIVKGSTPAQVYNCEQIINQLLAPSELAAYAGYTDIAPTSTKVVLPKSLANVPAYSQTAIEHAITPNYGILARQTSQDQLLWTEDVANNLK